MGEGLIYMGDGSWLPGVPARDLTPAEAEEHADAIAAHHAQVATPLYEEPEPDSGEEE
jgi:hypothetical protein